MKRSIFVGLACVLFVSIAFSHSSSPESFKLKGFHLGMEKPEVQTLYQKLKSE